MGPHDDLVEMTAKEAWEAGEETLLKWKAARDEAFLAGMQSMSAQMAEELAKTIESLNVPGTEPSPLMARLLALAKEKSARPD